MASELHSSLHLGHFGHGCLSVPSSDWRRPCCGGLAMHLLKHLDFISEKRKPCFLQGPATDLGFSVKRFLQEGGVAQQWYP